MEGARNMSEIIREFLEDLKKLDCFEGYFQDSGTFRFHEGIVFGKVMSVIIYLKDVMDIYRKWEAKLNE